MPAAAKRSLPRGRRFGGLVPEERRRQRRRQLIEAGLDVFGARGFHAVGVRDICAAAQLTERYFYESFDNLEGLFLAVYEDAVARIRHAILAAISEAPPQVIEIARRALRAFLEQLRDEPRLARILLIDVLTVNEDVRDRSQMAMQSFSDLVSRISLEFYPDQARHGLDARLVGSGLIGSTVYLVMRWAFGGFREPVEQMMEHCLLFYEAVTREAAARRRAGGGVPRRKRRSHRRR
jgi:AcrR family transcriptional regulator